MSTKENTLPTSHDRIYIAKVREYPYEEVTAVRTKLTQLATNVTIPEMVKYMKEIVPEFKSNNSEYELYDIE